MNAWDYRTIKMYLETWTRLNETYTDYVATLADGVRLEGTEAVLRRYLDDGGWELVSIVPTGFTHYGSTTYPGHLEADTLTLIFRRKNFS